MICPTERKRQQNVEVTSLSRKLSNVSINEGDEETPATDSDTDLDPQLVTSLKIAISSSVHEYRFNAIRQIRRFLCQDTISARVNQVIHHQLLPHMLLLLKPAILPSKIHYEACWCFTNLTAASTDVISHLIENYNLLDHIINLLHATAHFQVKAQCVWTLGNIAGDSIEFRNQVLGYDGIVGAILDVFNQSYTIRDQVKGERAAVICIWAISNLLRWKTHYELFTNALPILQQITLHSQEPELLSETLWALSRLFRINALKKYESLTPEFVSRLVKLLRFGMNDLIYSTNTTTQSTETLSVIIPVLRLITNILASEEEIFIQIFIDSNLLPELKRFLLTGNYQTKLESLLALSNLAAGTIQLINPLFTQGFIPILMDMYTNNGCECRLRKECLWVLSNSTTYKNQEQIRNLVENHFLESLVMYISNIATTTDNELDDPVIYLKSIQALLNILDSAGLESTYVLYISTGSNLINLFAALERIQGIPGRADEEEQEFLVKSCQLLKILFCKYYMREYQGYLRARSGVDGLVRGMDGLGI